ncbi:hypothetical protein ACFL1L_05420 [Thermoplasmatota archaeon]
MNNLFGYQRKAKFIDPKNANNTWINNYWGRPKILSKLIIGSLIINDDPNFPALRPWFKFDWHPAIKPFDIPSPEVNIV